MLRVPIAHRAARMEAQVEYIDGEEVVAEVGPVLAGTPFVLEPVKGSFGIVSVGISCRLHVVQLESGIVEVVFDALHRRFLPETVGPLP